MRKTIFYGIAILVTIIIVFALIQLHNKNTTIATQIVEQRDSSGIDPFAMAARVVLITYKSNRMDWWIDEDGIEKPLLNNGVSICPPTASIQG
jgi:hypothetical protein